MTTPPPEPTPPHQVRGSIGVQIGDQPVMNVNLPPLPAPVVWPVRVGVPSAVADRYQPRAAGAELERVLASGNVAVLTGARTTGVVLSGLGGVGKSQLAARHAQQVWRDESVDLVVWAGASNRSVAVTGYAEAAGKVLREEDPGIAQRSPEAAAAAFLTWLSTTDRRWLIILDDVQDPADLRELWPPHSPTGQVVVTTRRRDASLTRDDRQMIDVGVFTESESLSYLRAKLPNHNDLEGLAAGLGHLPLALAQAAAFIADKPLLTVAAYRERLVDRRNTLAKVMPGKDELADEHQATVAATWSLSIDRADTLPPQGLARPLLELISLLDPAGVPVEIFTSHQVVAHLGKTVERATDSDAVCDALGCLHRLSLITLDTTQPERAVQAHALLQRAVRDTLTSDHLTLLAHLAADALLAIWPEIDTNTPMTPALRTAAEVLHNTTAPALWSEEGHPLLFRAGQSLGHAGMVTAAMAHFRQIQSQALHHLGPDHSDTLLARGEYAHWLGQSGDRTGAIAELEPLLADLLRVLGPDHSSILIARGNLASCHANIGNVASAIGEFAQLLADRHRVLGPDHPDTLLTRNNLAHCRADSGDLLGAIADHEQLLADRLRVLGPDHPSTLLTRNNLASCRTDAGDVTSAIREFEQVLTDQLHVLGPDHPETLATRSNLAVCLARTGNLAGAIRDLEQLHADRRRVLGVNHPSTVTTRKVLAHWRELLPG